MIRTPGFLSTQERWNGGMQSSGKAKTSSKWQALPQAACGDSIKLAKINPYCSFLELPRVSCTTKFWINVAFRKCRRVSAAMFPSGSPSPYTRSDQQTKLGSYCSRISKQLTFIYGFRWNLYRLYFLYNSWWSTLEGFRFSKWNCVTYKALQQWLACTITYQTRPKLWISSIHDRLLALRHDPCHLRLKK